MLGVGVRVPQEDATKSTAGCRNKHILSCMSSCAHLVALGRSLGTRLASGLPKGQVRQQRSTTASLLRAVSEGAMAIFALDVFKARAELTWAPAMAELWSCGLRACGLDQGDTDPVFAHMRLSHAGAFLDMVVSAIGNNTVADDSVDALARRLLCDCTRVLAHLQRCKQVRKLWGYYHHRPVC